MTMTLPALIRWLRRSTVLLLLCGTCAVLHGATFVVRPVHLEVHRLVSQSRLDLGRGNLAPGLDNLQWARQLVQEHQNLFDANGSRHLLDLVNLVSQADGQNRLTRDRALVDESFASALKSLDPLVSLPAAPVHRVEADKPARFFSHLARLLDPRMVLLTPSVRKFSRAFQEGARRPYDNMLAEPANSTLVLAWLQARVEKRIFLTGARSDAPNARLIRERFEAQGYVVFFYQDCNPLCLESTVGAFFGTSGTVVHILSADAANSPFIPVEVALIERLLGDEPNVLILDGKEARRMALTPDPFVGAGIQCTLSQFVQQDSRCPVLSSGII